MVYIVRFLVPVILTIAAPTTIPLALASGAGTIDSARHSGRGIISGRISVSLMVPSAENIGTLTSSL